MKKFNILCISIFYVLNIYPQEFDNYDNLKSMANLGYFGNLHKYGTKYEGIKGTPNLFNAFVSSFLLIKEQKKYLRFESDIDLLRNAVIFMDPASGKIMEIPSDNVSELVFNKYDKQLIYRTTRNINFDKKIKENKFYQVIHEEPGLIMITDKAFRKADNEPTYNSGRHYDEYWTERKYYMEDYRGIFHQIVLNNMNYECIVHHARLNKRLMAKLYPDKKELIYRAFDEKPDSINLERLISILNKF